MSDKYFNGKRVVDTDKDLAEAIEELQQSAGVVVEANPEGEATADLEKLTVGENTYGIPKELPALPVDAEEKTYILKAVEGVLTWVEEETEPIEETPAGEE